MSIPAERLSLAAITDGDRQALEVALGSGADLMVGSGKPGCSDALRGDPIGSEGQPRPQIWPTGFRTSQPWVVYTASGRSAELVASARPRKPIFAFSNDAVVVRRRALRRGVTPLHTDHPTDIDAAVDLMASRLRARWGPCRQARRW